MWNPKPLQHILQQPYNIIYKIAESEGFKPDTDDGIVMYNFLQLCTKKIKKFNGANTWEIKNRGIKRLPMPVLS